MSFPQAANLINNKYSNMATAFNPLSNNRTFNGYDPKIPFNHNDFKNSNQLLHNNLDKNLMHEEIREYSVMIDSKDRNYQIYPNPFSYEVKFNPFPKSKEYINGELVTHEEPTPIINTNFTNVKYIKLEKIILPFYLNVRTEKKLNDDEELIDGWKVNTYKSLTDNPYIILSLGEYTDTNYCSTNDVLASSFATIYFDKKISNTHYSGISSNGIKIFPQDQLGKINRFKIGFMDPYGMQLDCPHVNKDIHSNMECHCIDPEGDEYTDCFKHNLFHPLNPIFQHHIQFKIGVIEPRLNKLTFN